MTGQIRLACSRRPRVLACETAVSRVIDDMQKVLDSYQPPGNGPISGQMTSR